jgi:mannose-6-phosphate isomerase-like protein (cupin superfamily)
MIRIILIFSLVISTVAVGSIQEARSQAGKTSHEETKQEIPKLPEGFGMWTPSDLKEREKALESKIGADHSARETLGDYGNHRIRFLHRAGTGAPEFHTHFVDLWIVEGGRGTLIVGGTLVDPKPLNGSGADALGDMTGSSIQGGERKEVSTGDVIHIPPKTPHQILVPEGGDITYLRIAIPSESVSST